jgi:hypothetical protein
MEEGPGRSSDHGCHEAPELDTLEDAGGLIIRARLEPRRICRHGAFERERRK